MDSSGERSSTGREFQVLGPLTANARSRDPPDFPCQTVYTYSHEARMIQHGTLGQALGQACRIIHNLILNSSNQKVLVGVRASHGRRINLKCFKWLRTTCQGCVLWGHGSRLSNCCQDKVG